MNLQEKIRQQHIDSVMRQAAATPHRRRIMHLNDIGSVGLVVHPLTDKDRVTISQFSSLMRKRSITLQVIEQPPDSDGQVDKYGLPKVDYLQTFVGYHYDVLIDATENNSLFGRYVMLRASSSLRVGYSECATAPGEDGTGGDEVHDLLILGRGTLDLSQYLPQILEYLVRIRKTNTP